MRVIVQSTESGRFLASDTNSGCVVWVRSLRDALARGVIVDEEHLAQLVEDHCDFGGYQIIDFDQIKWD